MLELDHVFLLTRPHQAPEADAVMAAGFTEGSRNVHPGQGTANRRIFFRNAMVEFLWVQNATDTETVAIAPMQFLARSQYRQSGYSPFGIGLRYQAAIADADKHLPFATWAFRPPYLPPHWEFAVAQTQPHEPLIFVMPFPPTRPDALPPEQRQPLNHPNQIRELTGLRITLAQAVSVSPALQYLESMGLVNWRWGTEPLMEIECDRRQRDRIFDFRPELSLIFHD